MNLGQGSHRRTPAWVWLVMFVCSAIVLPGAAIIFAQEPGSEITKENTNAQQIKEKSNQEGETGQPLLAAYYLRDDVLYYPQGADFKLAKKPKALRHARSQPSNQELAKVVSKYDSEKEEWDVRSFNVSKILERFETAGLESAEAKTRLILGLPCRYPMTNEGEKKSSTPGGRRIIVESIQLGGSEATIKIVGDRLWVYDTPTVVRHVQRMLRLEKETPPAIVVESRILTIRQESLKELQLDWEIGHSGPAQPEAIEGSPFAYQGQMHAANSEAMMVGELLEFSKLDAGSAVQAASFVEQASPVIHALVDDAKVREIVLAIRDNETMSLVQTPTVTMLSGSKAEVSDGGSQPFVVGIKRAPHRVRLHF